MLPSAVRGTMAALRPHAWHLSPAVGLALSAGGAHILARLYELEPRVPMAEGVRGRSADGSASVWTGSASGALTRELFHRNDPREPLRPTANRSLPAAHLSPSLCATVAGLAWERPGDAAVHQALREAVCSDTGLTVPQLARETGVTIARFERLVYMVSAADAEPAAPLPALTGTSLLMRLLWMRCTTRRELWTYLSTLHARHDALEPDIAAGSEAAFLGMRRFEAEELCGASVEAAARMLRLGEPQEALALPSTQMASAFETLAAAVALGGSRAPPLNQGRYGFKSQPAVADCAELCARELLNALLWEPDMQRFATSRLPAGSTDSLRAFYADDGPAYHEPRLGGAAPNTGGRSAEEAQWSAGAPVYAKSAERWFEMCSGLRGVPYLAGATPSTKYEVAPSLDAVTSCLGALLGESSVRTPAALERLWQSIQPERGVELRVNLYGDRLALFERCDEEPESKRCTLELVMSAGINHAFVIHHWRPPSWQAPLASRAHASLLTQLAASPPGQPPLESSDLDRSDEAASSLPRVALMPALLQPLLSAPPGLDSGSRDGDGDARDLAARRVLKRLVLMSTDPADHSAVGHALLSLLDAADESHALATDSLSAAAERTSDVHLGAAILSKADGLEGADDALLMAVAAAAARSGVMAMRHAALHAAPLAVPAAVLCGGDGSLAAWLRAAAASPGRCWRLSVSAALVRVRGTRESSSTLATA